MSIAVTGYTAAVDASQACTCTAFTLYCIVGRVCVFGDPGGPLTRAAGAAGLWAWHGHGGYVARRSSTSA